MATPCSWRDRISRNYLRCEVFDRSNNKRRGPNAKYPILTMILSYKYHQNLINGIINEI